ncbi:hypothetical protein FNF31_03450 [Cafeteria roenbergensis]|uniref:Kinesin-like protein n=1 Tax=Cafeteria roenbergensis TaxID=33653 RepID=A0A5A8DAW0_CAFRO|nr:hypothetical protein FNF31_03450 [Cafeteria roenbergensis]KAA0167651.1 hypothetical protein FNF28_02719 [Cafeteria roenbergensis]
MAASAAAAGDGAPKSGERSDHIRVFLRVRPTRRPSGFFGLDEESGSVRFDVPPDAAGLMGPNNTRSQYDFRFDGLFGMTARQEDVFERVAGPAVANALAGYNATIFAYGQTGSGKTFTITGGPQRYEDRGIIPRALQRIFQQCDASRKAGGQATVWISYLEVYNEVGYDLLEDSATGGHSRAGTVPGTKALEELPRVTVREDEYGNVHLGNLSLHRAESEEEALNLLFQGDTNRAICETAMNPVSSRSHCVFTISLEQREEGSPVVRRSKLHLVDLAGSERVHKTGATGSLFREATHINSSLLALRRVIDSLHERSVRRGAARQHTHVPYRDSTITSVLRDSLGGNCKTAVVATVSGEASNTDESISTCRFAQGVARIRNEACVNLETDPAVLVARLKEQVRLLQIEKDYAAGEAGSEAEIDEEERARVAAQAVAWAKAGPEDARPPEDAPMPDLGGLSLPRIREGFRALRELARAAAAGAAAGGGGGGDSKAGAAASAEAVAELRDMKHTLAQRNHEIAALVSIARDLREKLRAGGGGGGAHPGASGAGGHSERRPVAPGEAFAPAAAAAAAHADADAGARLPSGETLPWQLLDDRDASRDRFKAAYPRRQQLRDLKQALADKYAEAKQGAGLINRARGRVVELKAAVEELRVRRAMQALADSEAAGSDGTPAATADSAPSEAETGLLVEMEEQQKRYTSAFARLRELKGEIEYTRKLLEAGSVRMQSEFEAWFAQALLERRTRLTSATTPRRHEHAAGMAAPDRAFAPSATGGAGAGAGAQAGAGGGGETDDVARFYAARDQLLKLTGGGARR